MGARLLSNCRLTSRLAGLLSVCAGLAALWLDHAGRGFKRRLVQALSHHRRGLVAGQYLVLTAGGLGLFNLIGYLDGVKQSMTRTYIPRAVSVGATVVPRCRVRSLPCRHPAAVWRQRVKACVRRISMNTRHIATRRSISAIFYLWGHSLTARRSSSNQIPPRWSIPALPVW